MLEKYPRFDLEEELLKHLKMLREQMHQPLFPMLPEEDGQIGEQEYTSIEHDELEMFGKCIEGYREKYLQGGYSKHSIAKGISAEDSPFVDGLPAQPAVSPRHDFQKGVEPAKRVLFADFVRQARNELNQ